MWFHGVPSIDRQNSMAWDLGQRFFVMLSHLGAKRWQSSMLSFPRPGSAGALCSGEKRESSISIEYFWIPDPVGNDRKYSVPPRN
jgi:hypothetical protein